MGPGSTGVPGGLPSRGPQERGHVHGWARLTPRVSILVGHGPWSPAHPGPSLPFPSEIQGPAPEPLASPGAPLKRWVGGFSMSQAQLRSEGQRRDQTLGSEPQWPGFLEPQVTPGSQAHRPWPCCPSRLCSAPSGNGRTALPCPDPARPWHRAWLARATGRDCMEPHVSPRVGQGGAAGPRGSPTPSSLTGGLVSQGLPVHTVPLTQAHVCPVNTGPRALGVSSVEPCSEETPKPEPGVGPPVPAHQGRSAGVAASRLAPGLRLLLA